ncbi:hypothetical protein, partial [Acetomicrobium sp. S15 = DSM 107314]|uniref:hypothetical protein n=1 Tax=Acetomicrobium sp. S15 = DSM 107314 TaxID=2529858 RepID=UPI0018E16080
VAIVGGAGVSLLYVFLQHEELVKDTTVAHQRGETVMAVFYKDEQGSELVFSDIPASVAGEAKSARDAMLEAARRTMGWTLVLVALFFLGYALFGHLIPGQLGHRQYS